MIRHSQANCRNIERPLRGGFTLVELLIVIAIIGLLSAAITSSLAGLVEEGRIGRTKSQVTRINELINERWESYRTRPVPVRTAINVSGQTNAKLIAQTRLNAIRELMRMELPDRMSDVNDDPVVLKDSAGTKVYIPALTRSYRRWKSSSWNFGNQGAECLYMILRSIPDGDGTALNFFATNEKGDVDGDNMPEILDSWGKPIQFLRWAPGFQSDRQVNDALNFPDVFDPARADTRWPTGGGTPATNTLFNLYPLIFSAGPDSKYGIRTDDLSPSPLVQYSKLSPVNDPYHNNVETSPNLMLFGKNVDDNGNIDYGANDNIHNHLIEIK